MSLIKIKTLFENLISYDAWSIQLLKIKIQNEMEQAI